MRIGPTEILVIIAIGAVIFGVAKMWGGRKKKEEEAASSRSRKKATRK